jgi:hypothetical protein
MAFTEHGAIMAATILNSPQAVSMSIFVVRAFVKMREQLAASAETMKRLAKIDHTLLKHDQALSLIWQQIQPLLTPPPPAPKRQIGFHPEYRPARRFRYREPHPGLFARLVHAGRLLPPSLRQ